MAAQKVIVVGAGIIGSAISFELARRGVDVLLVDRQPPARAGASYGNVGHIAAELVEPLPSPRLLVGFWRELTGLGGPLLMPARRWLALLPWAWRFARAAFQRPAHTALLAPLVRPASRDWAALLAAAGQPGLLRQHGHYQFWQGRHAQVSADAEAAHMAGLGVPTEPAPAELVAQLSRAAGGAPGSGAALHFPDCAHVLDPAGVAEALVAAAVTTGHLEFRQALVSGLSRTAGSSVQAQLVDDTPVTGDQAIVCAGAWSAPLLKPFGVRVPLEAAYGYHLELPGAPAVVDAPILYDRQRLLVTPMAGRLRASSFMAFSGLDAPARPALFTRLAALLHRAGYAVPADAPRWHGPRPVLPDYLPGLGRAPDAPVWYALGHQHIGLTMAPVTAHLLADAMLGRPPRHDLAPFDLRRFD